MVNETMERGPTGTRVAANLRQLRRQRGLDLADVVDRLAQAGWPIGLNTLSKIERGQRRVDVDDLTALALALDVTPNRLLLGATADDAEQIALTGRAAPVSSRTAWWWACGQLALDHDPADPDGQRFPADGITQEVPGDLGRPRRFGVENRPHDPPDSTPWRLLVARIEQLDKIREMLDGLGRDGITPQAAFEWVQVMGRPLTIVDEDFHGQR